MLRTSESETEILLGNKQLLGIFLVVAVLLGVAFTGGFLVGRGAAAGKKAATVETATAANPEASSTASGSGGQTHTLEGEPTLPASASGGADAESTAPSRMSREASTETSKAPEPVLGSHKRPAAASAAAAKTRPQEPESRAAESELGYTPHSGAQYLQVAAVGRDEAEAVADVLHKKGFHAHAVPKPGNAKLYRVIIGPVKDAGELSSTRDALRKTGFREVIVQRF